MKPFLGVSFSLKEGDKGWKDLNDALRLIASRKPVVKAGIVGPEAEEEVEPGFNAVSLAATHEFGAEIQRGEGTIVIPERSYIRAPFDANAKTYVTMLAAVAKKVYSLKGGLEAGMNLIGMKMVKDMKGAIQKGLEPPLADSTKRSREKAGSWNKKGKSAGSTTFKPLWNTGTHILNRLQHLVMMRGEDDT